MLHLGLGSFHRAHQAVYLQRLIDAGDSGWSLAAANIRPDATGVVAALQAQGGRYTLETVSPAGEYRYELIEAIREVLPWESSLAAVISRGAAPSTRIVSFTVTEAGYYLDTQGKLDLSFSDLAADLERTRRGEVGEDRGEGVTVYGAVCAILRARKARQAGPVTLLNCDNLRHNGDRFRDGLREFIELAGDAELLSWVNANTLCPNAMVDRITPRPPPELRARVKAATGRDDAAAVTGESFIQWVIEDRFAAGRPDWGRVGVELVESVQPYEEAKIRILNATHSCIAWAGTLVGLDFIHEGTNNAVIRKMAYDYVTDDVIPCLSSPDNPGPIDLAAYRDVVLERFGNPAIRDTNQRVAADGFSKIPGFIAPTVRERLAAGQPIDSVAVLPALFLVFLRRWHRGTLPYAYQDQGMDEAVAHAICDAVDPVRALCSDAGLWGSAAGDTRLTDAVRGAIGRVAGFVNSEVKSS
ncbi:D-arabinitol 4-dehydrogenase [Polaromonas sp. LjRoot131]|uniref:D-arabinitol 4-dehydrogenase n=1 Tax=Polaromonas sp. LjRoot131 TaxID=3342262 RepID=UPI003ECFBB38